MWLQTWGPLQLEIWLDKRTGLQAHVAKPKAAAQRIMVTNAASLASPCTQPQLGATQPATPAAVKSGMPRKRSLLESAAPAGRAMRIAALAREAKLLCAHGCADAALGLLAAPVAPVISREHRISATEQTSKQSTENAAMEAMACDLDRTWKRSAPNLDLHIFAPDIKDWERCAACKQCLPG
jgi:hypothetical protein